ERTFQRDPHSSQQSLVEQPADEGDAVGDAALGIEGRHGVGGVGAQSLRAWATSTKPARRAKEGWWVWLEMMSISSRREGTIRRPTVSKRRAISPATILRKRSAWTKSTAERKRDWRKMFGQASGTCILSWSTPRVVVSSSKGATASRGASPLSSPSRACGRRRVLYGRL